MAVILKQGKQRLALVLKAKLWGFLTLRAQERRELINSSGFSGLGGLLELFIWHQSLDFEQGWPRKQLHTQLLSGLGSSPPAAHRATFEVTANSGFSETTANSNLLGKQPQ